MKTYDRYDVLADGDVSQLYVVKTEHDAEIAELKAACKGWEDGHNQLWDEVAELKAENEVLREQNWMMNKNTVELRKKLDTTRELHEYYKNQTSNYFRVTAILQENTLVE